MKHRLILLTTLTLHGFTSSAWAETTQKATPAPGPQVESSTASARAPASIAEGQDALAPTDATETTAEETDATETTETAPPPQEKPGADPESPSGPPPIVVQHRAHLAEEEARAAFLLGDELFLEGDYQGAIDSFERAYALSGRIEMLFNLANSHERLGNYEKASVALRGYIPHSPEEQRPALERRLERFEKLAQMKLEKEKETAEAVKDLKENPRPFPVARSLGIGFITLGSAGVVTGAAFAISAAGARKKLDETCAEGSDGRLCPSEADTALSRDQTHSLVADAALISGAVLGGIGVYLVIRSRKKEKEAVELRVGAGPGRLQLGGSF